MGFLEVSKGWDKMEPETDDESGDTPEPEPQMPEDGQA